MSFIELVAQRHPPKPPAGMQPPENAKDWFRISNSADEPDTTDILVYDSIGGWFGMWAEDFIDALDGVTTSKINLRLNSPGGSVFEGIAIANAIRQHPASVTVYVDSIAASIASVIAMAGDRLVMMPQSQIMVHNASGACYGDATEMTKMADMLDKQSLNIAQAYAQHTGRPLAEWQAYMDAETWFTAEEALTVGLADEVVPMRAKAAAVEQSETVDARMQRTWDLSMYQHAGRTNAPAPKIPLQVTPGQRITAELFQDVHAAAAATQPPSADPGKTVVDATDADTRLLDLIRAAVRQELESPDLLDSLRAHLDAPSGSGEERVDDAADEDVTDTDAADDITDEQPPADDSPPEATDASPPPPDEEEEEEGDEPPPGEEDEPADEADTWDQVVGFLVSPATSPGADDVFAQLKEGW